MVTPNYQYEKRQKALAKKKKQDEKRQRRLTKKTPPSPSDLERSEESGQED